MPRMTKAMLEGENQRLKIRIKDEWKYAEMLKEQIKVLKEQIKVLNISPDVLKTMCITVQRVASVTENLLQSIPAVQSYARKGGDATPL